MYSEVSCSGQQNVAYTIQYHSNVISRAIHYHMPSKTNNHNGQRGV